MWIQTSADDVRGPTRGDVFGLTFKSCLGRVAHAQSVWEALLWAWVGRALWEEQDGRAAHDALAALVWTLRIPPIAPRPVRVLLSTMRGYYYMGAAPAVPVLHGHRVALGMLRSWARSATVGAPDLRFGDVTTRQRDWVLAQAAAFAAKVERHPDATDRGRAFDHIVEFVGYPLTLCSAANSQMSAAMRAKCLDAERLGASEHIIAVCRALW